MILFWLAVAAICALLIAAVVRHRRRQMAGAPHLDTFDIPSGGMDN